MFKTHVEFKNGCSIEDNFYSKADFNLWVKNAIADFGDVVYIEILQGLLFRQAFFIGGNMYKYEIWCEGGWCHDSEIEFDDYDDCVEEAELDVSTYDEGTHWYEIKEV